MPKIKSLLPIYLYTCAHEGLASALCFFTINRLCSNYIVEAPRIGHGAWR